MHAVILGDSLGLRPPEQRLIGPESYQTVIEAFKQSWLHLEDFMKTEGRHSEYYDSAPDVQQI